MTREGGKASHANFSSEPHQILPTNLIICKYFSTHAITVMQSAECQNVLDVINFNWNQRTFHAALKDEKQSYIEDKKGMVIWKCGSHFSLESSVGEGWCRGT